MGDSPNLSVFALGLNVANSAPTRRRGLPANNNSADEWPRRELCVLPPRSLNVRSISSEGSITLSDISGTDPNLPPSFPAIKKPITERPPKHVDFIHRFTMKSNKVELGQAPYILNTDYMRTYYNEVLQFTRIATLTELNQKMMETIKTREFYIRKENYVDASMLSLCVLRHRVLIMESNLQNVHRKYNAWRSFHNDVAGEWTQPYGDLLIFPGLHKDISVLQDSLRELLKSMKLVKLLPGTLNTCRATKVEAKAATYKKRCSNVIIKSRLKYPHMQDFSLIFKPIFSNLFYRMESEQGRLAVEFYQSAFLVFFKFADWAQANDDLGWALLFVQLMQRSLERLVNILPWDEELTSSYSYVMCHWLVARCFSLVFFSPDNFSTFKQSYELLRIQLKEFRREFFYTYEQPSAGNTIENNFPYKLQLEFPYALFDCLESSSLGFVRISFTPDWLRSRYEQESVMWVLLFVTICHWTEELLAPWQDFVSKKKQVLETIGVNIELLRNIRGGNPDYKILLNCITAKRTRLMLGITASLQMDDPQFRIYRVRKESPDSEMLDYRRQVQREAMALINEEYASPISYGALRTLLTLATKTMFDEVIYCMESQEHDPSNTNNVDQLMSILPVVVDIWFRPHSRQCEWTNKIPAEDLEYFYPIVAMFFFGLSRCYSIMYDKYFTLPLESNQRYCYAVFAALLRHEGAKEGVLRAFLDHALLMERCCLGDLSSGSTLKNIATRAMLVLKRLVWLLPVIHELLIDSNLKKGFSYAWRQSISPVEQLLPNEVIKDIPNMSTASKAVFEKVIRYIYAELGFQSSGAFDLLPGSGKFLRVRHQPLRFFTVCYEKQEPRDDRLDSFDDYDPRVPVLRSCPIESYYHQEEESYSPLERYDVRILDGLFNDFRESRNDKNGNLDDILKRFRQVLRRLVEQEVIALRKITSNAAENDKITNEVKTLNKEAAREKDCKLGEAIGQKHLTPSQLLVKFKIIQKDLKSEDHFVLVLSRVLFKLDKLLYQEEISQLLRGDISI